MPAREGEHKGNRIVVFTLATVTITTVLITNEFLYNATRGEA